MSKIVSGKDSQRLLDYTKPSATDVLKTTWKGVIPKTAERTGDLTGSKSFWQN